VVGISAINMKVIDPGHMYKIDMLDGYLNDPSNFLVFVKRNNPPEKYPGNLNSYPGTTIQEVLRALINRIKYLQNQKGCEEDVILLNIFREGILLLEQRNAREKGRGLLVPTDIVIEDIPTCPECLHIGCQEHD